MWDQLNFRRLQFGDASVWVSDVNNFNHANKHLERIDTERLKHVRISCKYIITAGLNNSWYHFDRHIYGPPVVVDVVVVVLDLEFPVEYKISIVGNDRTLF